MANLINCLHRKENNFAPQIAFNLGCELTNKRKTERTQTIEGLIQSVNEKYYSVSQTQFEKLKDLDTKLFPIPINSVLDFGAGNGDILLDLKKKYNLTTKSTFAIDMKLKKLDGATLLEYNNYKIPLDDSSIDLVVCFMVLHHISPDDRHHLLQEFYRILKPTGLIIIREHASFELTSLNQTNIHNFHIFLDILHMFWYITNSEMEDPLWLMSRNSTLKLFSDNGFTSGGNIFYNSDNSQRIYHEIYIKESNLK